MANGAPQPSRDRLRSIADQLDELGTAVRAIADRGGDAEPSTGVDAEVTRALARAAQAIDRNVATALATIVEAEREARERILATTESVCERIEAVDNAQERVARALAQLGTSPSGDASG